MNCYFQIDEGDWIKGSILTTNGCSAIVLASTNENQNILGFAKSYVEIRNYETYFWPNNLIHIYGLVEHPYQKVSTSPILFRGVQVNVSFRKPKKG